MHADVIVVGAGLAGLVAATEIAAAGKRAIIVDQEPQQSLGGQAFWSLGGLFMVDTPEQRRLGVRDSHDIALRDWTETAGFDRTEDEWPRKWAEAYVAFACGEKRAWLHELGMRWFPIVGWAERSAGGRGNSVPRFHVTWGTGPGVLAPFIRIAREAEQRGLISFRFRHRVDELIVTNGRVNGVRGAVLEPSNAVRGAPSSRTVVGEFELHASAVIVASGGIGGDHELVRKHWPARMRPAPASLLQGVPDHVDGRMLGIASRAGARLINEDRMWHYTEGVRNWAPIWNRHGIRILPGPSSVWLDATGKRFPSPFYPGFDTLGMLEQILKSGFDYSWFVLDQSIIKREFALSGSEQNPDLTNKSVRMTLGRAFGSKATGPVEAFKARGADFVVRSNLRDLVDGMNALAGHAQIDFANVQRTLRERDAQMNDPASTDGQVAAIRRARKYIGDRLVRVAKPYEMLGARSGPLIAVKLNILTRKSLGGCETDLEGRVFGVNGALVPGLYAVGEAAGFGGGGMHGYRALEGTFLGGCIFSGRNAGRSAAKSV